MPGVDLSCASFSRWMCDLSRELVPTQAARERRCCTRQAPLSLNLEDAHACLCSMNAQNIQADHVRHPMVKTLVSPSSRIAET